jgi:hypothetical protein
MASGTMGNQKLYVDTTLTLVFVVQYLLRKVIQECYSIKNL